MSSPLVNQSQGKNENFTRAKSPSKDRKNSYITNYQNNNNNNNNNYISTDEDVGEAASPGPDVRSNNDAKNKSFSETTIAIFSQSAPDSGDSCLNSVSSQVSISSSGDISVLGDHLPDTVDRSGITETETETDYEDGGKKAHFLIGNNSSVVPIPTGTLPFSKNSLKRTGKQNSTINISNLTPSPPHLLNDKSSDEARSSSSDSHPHHEPSHSSSVILIPKELITTTTNNTTTNTSTMTNGKLLMSSSTTTSDLTNNNGIPNNRHLPSPILCKTKEENFECLADGSESFFDSATDNTSLQYFRDDLSGCTGSSNSLPFRRNSLLRSSLRKSPQNSNGETMGHRRVGSFRNPSGTKRSPVVPAVSSSSALAATQLYRSSSFHSSGRSSAGDVEEMYSDGSIEDEVIDLTQKYNHLEEKFTVLAENQSNVDDRYARSKQENIELSTKLFMLEEQMRDVEQRGEERLREEQRRSKDYLARLEREKELQIANFEIRLQSIQKDLELSKSEGVRLKGQLDRERSERDHLSDKIIETERELSNLRDVNRKLMDEARTDRDALTLETLGSQQALLDLKREFESLRKYQMGKPHSNLVPHRESIDDVSELHSRLTELEEENKRLKNENRSLQESNDDLTAQILNHGLEEGRQLLTMTNFTGMGNSLAAEFEAMSQDQMKTALKEQKEVNDQLKAYIDNILISIVENYPQLLEVKNKCNGCSQDSS